MATTLTKQAIEALIARARGKKGPQLELIDDREPGLRIRAGERSTKWSLSVRLKDGTRTRVTLGPWPELGISDAREAARDAKKEIAKGIDPNAAKKEAKEAARVARRSRRSLKDVLDDYETAKLAHLRRGAATRRALDGKRGLLRDLANREPRSITRADIADAVRRHAKSSPIAANRALAYARAFFNWCVRQDILEGNPAANVEKPGKEKQRDRFHTLDELQEIWEAAGTLGYPFGPLYRLLTVLPMRREEIAAMPVAELDLGSDDDPTQGVWTLPAARTKRANALRVPLSPLARSIIKEALADPARPKDSPFVFSTTGETSISGFAKGKRRLDAAIENTRAKAAAKKGAEPQAMPHWTIHDLRTTFNTHACERLNVDAMVADRILNHVASATTSKIMRVYNKSELFDQRKAALCVWASMIESDVLKSAPAKVVPLRRSADAA
jgi:integrase